jgi:hypothetical protein
MSAAGKKKKKFGERKARMTGSDGEHTQNTTVQAKGSLR